MKLQRYDVYGGYTDLDGTDIDLTHLDDNGRWVDADDALKAIADRDAEIARLRAELDAAKADCEFYKSGWADLQAAIESEYDHGGAAGFTTLHKIIRDTWKMRDERNAALAAKENPNAKA